MIVSTFDGLFAGLPDGLALDGADAQVIVHGPGYTAAPSHTTVDDIPEDDIIIRVDATLTASEVAGVVEVAFAEVSADIDGAPVVGGWALALGEASDDPEDCRLLAYAVDPGGTPPDPYTVTLTSYAFRFRRA